MQEKRIGSFHTPRGEDKLVLVKFECHEGLGELFDCRIEALGTEKGLDATDLLGKPCHVSFQTVGGGKRHFAGIVTEVRWLGIRDEWPLFGFVLRPWLWLLGRTSGSRIFQQKSVEEIVRDVVSAAKFADFEFNLAGHYDKLEYCVQYQETSLNFVLRLMEEFGIYFYFEHGAGRHKLVLVDGISAHKPVPGANSLRIVPRRTREWQDKEHLHSWTVEASLRSDRVVLNDYDDAQPNAKLLVDASAADGSYEIYHHPGRYSEADAGRQLAQVRLESEQAQAQRRTGYGSAISCFPGGLVKVEGHGTAAENRDYLVVRTWHTAAVESYGSVGGADDAGDVYDSVLELQAKDRPFRSPQSAFRPAVRGPQTARVVGKKGEEIDVDSRGRILVQFHWDRERVDSRRVRVAQSLAGKGWGMQAIPRIGQEVVVEFLEGDPDRPLVTGVVYNGTNPLPYSLPENKTTTGLKSNSSLGGGGFNQLAFGDKAGAETVDFRAERDFVATVRRRETRDVGAAFATARGAASRSITVKKGDDKLSVESGNQDVEIGGSQTVEVGDAVEISAGTRIVLKVGASKVVIDASSVTISSPKIKVDGMETAVNGSAELTATGALVKIN
ncbi:type VI secretion system Vgr family protein [Zavarzinia sp.]|uniref:type VI secretion system Vgr family protein n=1 Tax=Zavarzinia sp. TaxID=2027920 RepID=UPI003565C581